MPEPHIPNLNIDKQAILADYTTFRLGGGCKGLIHYQTPEDLTAAVKTLYENKLPFILIGGGSNLVISDQDVDVYILRYVTDQPIVEWNDTKVTVSGSTILDQLVELMAQKGVGGLDYCSGIPGTVGGAVVGNAGAFGKQIGDVIREVTLLDREGNILRACPDELQFSYRHSALKESDHIVLSATLNVHPKASEILLKGRKDILELRAQKHPDLSRNPCAGSFFRNIEPTSKAGKRQAAGWFLEQAGGKSLSVGGAKIFEKHANIIVKGQNCKAQDVLDLSLQMQELVSDRFALDLVREVRFVGDFKGKPDDAGIIW